MDKKTILDVNFKNKKTLVRVDFNVPIIDGQITDDNRIVQALPTIKYLVEKEAKVILLSHLGRVKEEKDLAKNDLTIVSKRLQELLGQEVLFVPYIAGKEVEEAVANLKPGQVMMLQNTRYADLEGKRESKNDPELGKYWASLGEVFVNDAFGVAHRAQASNVGIAQYLPTVAGFLIEKEVKYLGSAVNNPKRPLVAVLGGAKVSDKILVIENLLKVCDKVIIGGAMAFTFARALGGKTGLSLVEEDKIDLAKEVLEKSQGKLVLGVDVVTGKEFKNDTPRNIRSLFDIPSDEEGLDAGPKSLEKFTDVIKDAKTVIWNGPLGVCEFDNFAHGTLELAKQIAKNEDAISIIGGGDSASAIIKLGMADKFTHISTGGGASMEFLEGKKLPGIEAIENK